VIATTASGEPSWSVSTSRSASADTVLAGAVLADTALAGTVSVTRSGQGVPSASWHRAATAARSAAVR
jgi:hypothetical protein